MCRVFLAKARFVRRIHACMVNTASNELYGGEGLREIFTEQGLMPPLSHPRPQAWLSFSLPVDNHKKIEDSRVFFTDGKEDFIYKGNTAISKFFKSSKVLSSFVTSFRISLFVKVWENAKFYLSSGRFSPAVDKEIGTPFKEAFVFQCYQVASIVK